MANTTEWYPATIKPVREGVYELRDGGGPLPFPFHMWADGHWHASGRSPSDVPTGHRDTFHGWGYMKTAEWRGLTEQA